MNSRVLKLDAFLGAQVGPDYWSDVSICIATAITATFDADDWTHLAELICERDSVWRLRCAESLGDEVCERAAKVLLELMQDNDREVAIAALDSLNSQAQLGLSLADSKEIIADVISTFSDQPDSVATLVISDLRNRLARY